MKPPDSVSVLRFLALLLISAVCTASAEVNEIIVVFKTHFDIGYTDLASNVVQRYRTSMIDQALAVADQNRDLPPTQQFVWTLPGWPMKKILENWPGQTPQRKERVRRAFADGRFVVHALPFTMHTELLEAEDLVRGLGFSAKISRANGKALPRDAKMTDVPSHSWILPTLLKHAGVDFLHLGCNPASSSPVVPLLFWWEGPDGSRLLTLYSAGDYGGGLIPPTDWPHKTWLAMMMTGDNHGPPKPEEVQQILDQAKQKLPGAKVRIGRLADFYEAILAEKPDLPVVRGDMADTWIFGPMSDPDGAKIARNLRPAIAAAECLGTELCAWGVPSPASAPILAEAYELSLLYGEHTWGGSIPWIYGRYLLKFGDEWKQDRALGKFQRIEASWDEHTAYISHAQNLISPLLQAEMNALAQAVRVRGPRVVVFNPLPWTRSGVATIQLSGAPASLTDSQTGRAVPSVELGSNALSFVATDVPPGGYRTFRLQPGRSMDSVSSLLRATNHTLENSFFKLTLAPAQGTVRSLIDKRSGRELVDAGASPGFGQYLYERFDRDQVQAFVRAYVKIDAEWATNELGKPGLPPTAQTPYRAASPRQFQVRYELTPVSVTAVMDAAADADVPHAVTTRLTLYRDQAWVELAVTVHDKMPDAWPEAGWLCLPFKLVDPVFRLGRLGAIVDPAKDIVPGCNYHQFALNSGMLVTDPAGQGVGLCPQDSPLVSLGEPGCWKYSKTFTPRLPRVFVNLFNNQWSTNFRLWNAGTWTSRVRLWAVAGPNGERELVTAAEEARVPLLAAFADGPAGKLPTLQTGLQLSLPGVKATAFGPNPDGDGTLLRLWEQSGRSGNCTVRLPTNLPATTVLPVNLRGQPNGQPIAVLRGAFTVSLHAYAPASFLLQP